MIAKSVGELISEWYGRPEEEFLAAHTVPVLVGVGVLDVRLLRDPHRHGSTLCLGFELQTARASSESSPLVGTLLAVEGQTGPQQRRITVGRAASSDIVVDDAAVSETHCAIDRRGDELMLVDLGSTNGTLLNGTPVEPALAHGLRSEDIVTLGRNSFQYFTPKVLFQYLQLCPPPP